MNIKWLVGALLLAVAAWWLIGSDEPAHRADSAAEPTSDENTTLKSGIKAISPSVPQTERRLPPPDEEVINIGEPMDPDDPSTWPQDENQEVINIGEPMDPDDPSTWPQDENQEVINIGEPMDPDDPSTWPQDENQEVINIGEPMDPDDPSTWPQDENQEVINIGEPMDPDDPSTWPGGGEALKPSSKQLPY